MVPPTTVLTSSLIWFPSVNYPESFFLDGSVQEEFKEPITEDPPKPFQPRTPLFEVDYMPLTLAVSKQSNDKKGHFLFKALLDHGESTLAALSNMLQVL